MTGVSVLDATAGAPLAPLLTDPDLWSLLDLPAHVSPVTSHDHASLHLLLQLGIIAGDLRGERILAVSGDPIGQLLALASDDPVFEHVAGTVA